MGGTFLESSDIRTIAQQMTAAILSTPEVSSNTDVSRIALASVRNNTRFLIDSDIFLRRLRIELNRVSQGRVRFFMQDNAQEVRREVLLERDEVEWDAIADELAEHLLRNTPKNADGKPLRIAVGSVRKTNVIGMNAESFLVMVRTRLAERSEGRVVFVSDQVSRHVLDAMEEGESGLGLGADCLLCGEFMAEGMQVAEGRQDVELKVKEKREVFTESYSKEDTEEQTYLFETKENPNVTKRFNCQLVVISDGTVLSEKMVLLENKVRSGIGAADYILTGEISALSKASQGAYRSDYVIVSFQLVAPQSNEVLWEDAYESKRATKVGTVYR